jgi:hypothetical protein
MILTIGAASLPIRLADQCDGECIPPLLENREETCGGVFPVEEELAAAGVAWWNGSTEEKRRHWRMMVASAMPAVARHAYLLADAYNDALDEAQAWVVESSPD